MLPAAAGRAAGQGAPALSVSSIERRLSGLASGYAQRGGRLDRKNRHIASVLAGIRRKHARPPVRNEAILPEALRDMLATLPHDMRGLRDPAILMDQSWRAGQPGSVNPRCKRRLSSHIFRAMVCVPGYV